MRVDAEQIAGAYEAAVEDLTSPVVPVGVDVNDLPPAQQRALIRAGMAASRARGGR